MLFDKTQKGACFFFFLLERACMCKDDSEEYFPGEKVRVKRGQCHRSACRVARITSIIPQQGHISHATCRISQIQVVSVLNFHSGCFSVEKISFKCLYYDERVVSFILVEHFRKYPLCKFTFYDLVCKETFCSSRIYYLHYLPFM